MIVKEILDYNIGIFVIADTDDVTYKINSEAEIDDHIISCYKMLGKVIGKSIFEKIMINAYFDRTIINFILGRKINLSDIFFYDKHLYKSWSYLLSTQLNDDEFIDNFVIYRKIGTKVDIRELKPGGSDI